ncbi:hypothetical protein [Acetobacter sp.]|jgi:hypothetical protein|uniref:hypothetical protein n=1 Tax=Acetobacter sp. TaxID=440 RepID=UPI0025C0AF12|nr:hypothetical protein [Acetobacter sp.]MCH4092600.1 hypothetical protein [Acetobacter sp.]MCI1299734.1 hypothetical protein [Acetobacter sp.]MCI1315386.1 hypothetical protein [Acetobacter sp.]
MSGMRELSLSELNTVSGGCCYNPRPACGGFSQVSLSGMIGAYAGYLAGMYNVGADYFNHASSSTIASAWQNVGNDMKIGYSIGSSMSVSGALSLLQQTVSTINSAVTVNKCGRVTSETLIAFPISTGSALG